MTPAAVEPSAFERRYAEWSPGYPTSTAQDAWLVGQIVHASLRVDQCQADERFQRHRLALRASSCWDDDRRLAAEELGSGLSRRPSLVARALRKTTQGCAWLIERWTALGHVLRDFGAWSEAQDSLALDLLGIPAELRDGPTRLDPVSGDDPVACRARVVAEEVDRLTRLKAESLDDLDAFEQESATLGLPTEPDRTLTHLHRLEFAALRIMQWAERLLKRPNASTNVNSDPEPQPSPAPPPPPPPPAPKVPPSSADSPRRVTPVGKELDTFVDCLLAAEPLPAHVPASAPISAPTVHTAGVTVSPPTRPRS